MIEAPPIAAPRCKKPPITNVQTTSQLIQTSLSQTAAWHLSRVETIWVFQNRLVVYIINHIFIWCNYIHCYQAMIRGKNLMFSHFGWYRSSDSIPLWIHSVVPLAWCPWCPGAMSSAPSAAPFHWILEQVHRSLFGCWNHRSQSHQHRASLGRNISGEAQMARCSPWKKKRPPNLGIECESADTGRKKREYVLDNLTNWIISQRCASSPKQ